jgi:rubrerythrin
MIISKEYPAAAFSKGFRAHRGYLVFAALAEKEGYHEIARIFRATAQAETVQAPAHLWALERLRTTGESLGGAGSGVTPELQEISPMLMVAAEDQGPKKPPGGPRSAKDQEKTHSPPYQKALKRLAELGKGDYYVCSECGYTIKRKRPEKCPHCRSEAITLVKVG